MSDMFSGFHVAMNGMSAERRRLQVISTNIANANTTSEDGPYVRKSVVFSEVLSDAKRDANGPLGVRAVRTYEDRVTEHPRVHQPDHPGADSDGYVRLPNVNIMLELVDMMVARRSYQSNLAAFRAWRGMLRTSIQAIGAR